MHIICLCKEDYQSSGYVGLLGLPLQSNSSNCLLLILHEQLDILCIVYVLLSASYVYIQYNKIEIPNIEISYIEVSDIIDTSN